MSLTSEIANSVRQNAKTLKQYSYEEAKYFLDHQEPPQEDTVTVSVLSNSIFSNCAGKMEDGTYFCTGSELGLLSSFVRAVNRTLKFTKPADWRYGSKLANGSWNGHLGLISRGEADVAVGGITHTDVRNADFSFSHMVHGTYYTFTSGKPGLQPPSAAVYRIFDTDLWIWILVSFLGMSAFYHVLSKLVAKLHDDFDRGAYDATFKLFGSIMRQCFDDMVEAKYRPKAAFLTSYFIAHGFLGMAYAAAILAFLVIPLRYPGIRHLEEAVTKTHKPFLISRWDLALQDMFATSNNSLYKRIRNEGRVTLCGETCDPYINDTVFYFGDIHVTKLILANLSNYGMEFDLGRESIRPTSFAWPMRRGSPLKPVFDDFILWAHAFGIPDHYLESEIRRKFPQERPGSGQDAAGSDGSDGSGAGAGDELLLSLTMEHLTGAWFLWVVGIAASAVAFLGEGIVWKAWEERMGVRRHGFLSKRNIR